MSKWGGMFTARMQVKPNSTWCGHVRKNAKRRSSGRAENTTCGTGTLTVLDVPTNTVVALGSEEKNRVRRDAFPTFLWIRAEGDIVFAPVKGLPQRILSAMNKWWIEKKKWGKRKNKKQRKTRGKGLTLVTVTDYLGAWKKGARVHFNHGLLELQLAPILLAHVCQEWRAIELQSCLDNNRKAGVVLVDGEH
ncbi:hypothetical protein EI94DRAFT_1695494 [Lactarius quietus]|nr:hypothetical protein EI94DRAFT_1695494 [Lactarius quietus]